MSDQSDEEYIKTLQIELDAEKPRMEALKRELDIPSRPRIGDIIFIRNDKLSRLGQIIVRRKKVAFSHVYLCVSFGEYIHATPDEYNKYYDFNNEKEINAIDKTSNLKTLIFGKKKNKNTVRTGVFKITEHQLWEDIKKAIDDANNEKNPSSDPVWRVHRNKILSSDRFLKESLTERAEFYLGQKYSWWFFLIRLLGKNSQLSQSFCSELVAKVFQDIEMPIIEAKPSYIFPVDVFEATVNNSQWEDVTDVYDRIFSVLMSDTEREKPSLFRDLFRDWIEENKLVEKWLKAQILESIAIEDFVRGIAVDNAVYLPLLNKVIDEFAQTLSENVREAFERGILNEENFNKFIPSEWFNMKSLKSWYEPALYCLERIGVPEPSNVDNWVIDIAKLKNPELYTGNDWASIQKKLLEQSSHMINENGKRLMIFVDTLVIFSEAVFKLIEQLEIGNTIDNSQVETFEKVGALIKDALQGLTGFDNYDGDLDELRNIVLKHIVDFELKNTHEVSCRYRAIYQQLIWRKKLQRLPLHEIIDKPLSNIKIETALAVYISALELCPFMTIES